MDFGKFFIVAMAVNIMLYFGSAWIAEKQGTTNPFGFGAEFISQLIPTSGNVSESYYSKYTPTSSNQTGSVNTAEVLPFISGFLKFFNQVVAFLNMLFSLLVAPAVILSTLGAPTVVVVLIGGLWIFGELMGIIQFMRGGSI